MSATATIETDGSAILNLDGKDHKIPATNVVTTRLRIRELVTEHAARTGEPQTLVAHDESGSWDVVIHPDGRTETVNPFAVPEPAHGPSTLEGTVVPALAPLPSRREARSFLVPNEAPEEPPQQGFRAFLSRAALPKPASGRTRCLCPSTGRACALSLSPTARAEAGKRPQRSILLPCSPASVARGCWPLM